MQGSITDTHSLEALIQQVKASQSIYATYKQEQVDAIFKQAAIAANQSRVPLAKLAVAETAMGVAEDKVIKNHFASEIIYNKYKQEKTCGVISEDSSFGIHKDSRTGGNFGRDCPHHQPHLNGGFKSLVSPQNPQRDYFFSPSPSKAMYDTPPLKALGNLESDTVIFHF
jgi:acetaldehyde dehydrogenase/alcohol dehydrogenase